ncbi:hypothetical protein J7T55_003489 [Diaporthe amygdali]|uniref:uncharacterized protein n=1 Tax=Phomopsis amygdali TaxID=1214568 RepID=UPI0022FE08B3|nr:uncharacterized protein J7T55_003489 [Diaporthe amygdali]KAJ0117073.1 hypothetical protein J7T55_003489 [Diaporthe amygdali]
MSSNVRSLSAILAAAMLAPLTASAQEYCPLEVRTATVTACFANTGKPVKPTCDVACPTPVAKPNDNGPVQVYVQAPKCDSCGCDSCAHTNVYTTTYDAFCPTGLSKQQYVVTEVYAGMSAKPTVTAAPKVPFGFAVDVKTCNSCGPKPITATLTYPANGCPYIQGVSQPKGAPAGVPAVFPHLVALRLALKPVLKQVPKPVLKPLLVVARMERKLAPRQEPRQVPKLVPKPLLVVVRMVLKLELKLVPKQALKLVLLRLQVVARTPPRQAPKQAPKLVLRLVLLRLLRLLVVRVALKLVPRQEPRQEPKLVLLPRPRTTTTTRHPQHPRQPRPRVAQALLLLPSQQARQARYRFPVLTLLSWQ